MRVWMAGCALAALAACGTIEIGAPPEDGARAPAQAPPSAPAPRPPPPAPAAPAPSRVEEMAALANRHRATAGCPPLVWLDAAARAAQAHSDDMAERGYFSHVAPDGQTFSERLAREGVMLRMGAENIALDPGSPAQVLGAWVRSPGHRRNLEECGYTHHGVGERAGRWTHVFVTPVSP